MISVRLSTAIVAGVVCLSASFRVQAGEPTWHVGRWDSTIYNRSERPRTVAVRIEVQDAETGLPVPDAVVSLRGHFLEEKIGPASGRFEPYEPQTREFELRTETPRDGIVVFALGWEKRYPWDLGGPEPEVNRRGVVKYRDVHSTWIRPVDDLEKVQEIRVRHPQYQAFDDVFNFDHLLRFGQDRNSQSQVQRVFAAFEQSWHREMTTPGVKFFVLKLGTRFSDFQNKASQRSDFFEKIRRKDFGTVYLQPHNWFSKGEHPQSECGPYFAYLLEVRLARRSGMVDVNVRRRTPSRASTERRRTDWPRAEQPQRRRPPPVPKQHDDARRSRYESAREQEALRAERERRAREQRLLEEARRSPLGIVVETITTGMRRELGLYPGTTGVVVVFVASGSPAEAGGLRPGTVIESVTHRAVTDVASFTKHIGSGRPGSQYMVGVWRKSSKGKWERANRPVRIPD